VSAQRFVVTGGAGFIGSSVVARLLGCGHGVVVVDSLAANSSRRSVDEGALPPDADFLAADVRDSATLLDLFADADVVIHAAAENHVTKSIAVGAAPFVAANVAGTVAVLEAALAARRVERVVLVSSSEIYGDAVCRPMTEVHPLMPHSPYAATKASADRIASAYATSHGLSVVIVRPFNTYGPRQRPEALVARLVMQALKERPFTIEGSGMATRDWLHVDDTARGIIAAATAPLDAVLGGCFNLATGVETSVIDVACAVSAAVGRRTFEVNALPERPGQVQSQVGCAATAERALGWVSSIPLTEGIRQTVGWYREHERWWAAIRVPEWWAHWLASVKTNAALTLEAAP
jgi:dTDP-glucose 4,6-dehydratase